MGVPYASVESKQASQQRWECEKLLLCEEQAGNAIGSHGGRNGAGSDAWNGGEERAVRGRGRGCLHRCRQHRVNARVLQCLDLCTILTLSHGEVDKKKGNRYECEVSSLHPGHNSISILLGKSHLRQTSLQRNGIGLIVREKPKQFQSTYYANL